MKSAKLITILGLFIISSCASTKLPPKELVLRDNLSSSCETGQPGNLIISNRNRTSADSEFKYFGNKLAAEESLKNISVCCVTDTWSFEEHKTFEKALNILNPEKDILVFVHGDGKLFSEIMERTILLQKLYDLNVISFDYPSEDPSIRPRYKNYFNSIQNVEKSIPQLQLFLENLQRYIYQNERFKNSKITLLFHSLGGYVFQKSIEEKIFQNIDKDLFDNIILNAAAVSQSTHAQWLDKSPFSSPVYVTHNLHDFTLRGANILNAEYMLGILADGTLSSKAIYLDFSEIYLFEHNYFLMEPPKGNSAAKEVYDQLIHGIRPDLNSRRFHLKEDIRVYEVIED